ncbi:hypothetical protein [uncultured Dechloromonas sp.]|uniref:hypothetical protein n=1 Tax=uncultured Dechloromonas sp. TaxID=171719 RepID=UPI0025F1B5DD|nr:hypothetical protein [uncultured Dechloromonas sp.]
MAASGRFPKDAVAGRPQRLAPVLHKQPRASGSGDGESAKTKHPTVLKELFSKQKEGKMCA